MTTDSSGNELDELMRLSQQLQKQAHDTAQREKQSARQRNKSQGILSELRAFSISMAVEQLQLVATPDKIEQVNALKSKQGTTELRKLIDNLASDLEKQISIVAITNPDIKPIEQSIRTLTIILGLFFSLNS
ncbi:hypothetical protein ACFLWW_03310 [Chloroflexota bacterium]